MPIRFPNNIKPIIYNVSCIESAKLDLHQAKAIVRYKPDIIFLEYPNNSAVAKSIKKHGGFSSATMQANPWVRSDIVMWENIKKLRDTGHTLDVYGVDGPTRLVTEMNAEWGYMYPCALKNWFWWVRIYLRERYMAEHIAAVLKNYKGKKNPVILVFLQSFHWDHTQFILGKPTKKELWDYYFGKFENINSAIVADTLKKRNKVLYSYWQKFPL